MNKNIFSSKAQTLLQVQSKISIFVVPKLLYFDINSFNRDSVNIVKKIKDSFEGQLIALRSSAADEDNHTSSCAGEYDSVLNIPSNNQEKITESINTIIHSYQKKRKLLSADEVIVQKMVKNTVMSGVIFTHDLNSGAPYYVINYDDQSGLTDTVTSGDNKYSNRTLYIHRNSVNNLRSERFIKLLSAVQDLEQAINSEFLDVEFALGEDLTPYLLQVRAITTQSNWDKSVSECIDKTLKKVQLFVDGRLKRMEGVYGKTTLLGQMPDWNPVEMIGRAPRALAASIYQTLITNHVWSDARLIMGYKAPSDQPLMLMLAGQPFIDTRLSFHSYLPQDVSPVVAEKLVDCWVENLKNSPELHDKIEFDVAITTYSFDFDEEMGRLIGSALTTNEKNEFKQIHLKQTRDLITGRGEGSIRQALKKVSKLNDKHKKMKNIAVEYNLPLLATMIDDCIQFGTIPFSILARHGFIAITILLSLNRCGIITKNEVNKIQSSLQTVAGNVVNDMHALKTGELSKNEFMSRYGHLRPGTYDIMSHRYDQMGNFFNNDYFTQKEKNLQEFNFSLQQEKKINKLLEKDGFVNFDSNNLLSYIREAIISREYGKFIFSRSVSNILELIANFAGDNGLSRNEISHVPLSNILNIASSGNRQSVKSRLKEVSRLEEEKHRVSKAIRLPQLLIDQAGAHIVPFQVSHPNFITHKKITALCQVLNSESGEPPLNGKIVLIEGADPGFDWIFSQKISGLVTKYGGVNSHMAIRCAEFGIPAAIGCGEQRFNLLLKSNQAHLDCAVGLIDPLH